LLAQLFLVHASGSQFATPASTIVVVVVIPGADSHTSRTDLEFLGERICGNDKESCGRRGEDIVPHYLLLF
jgi:hypothetical protein